MSQLGRRGLQLPGPFALMASRCAERRSLAPPQVGRVDQAGQKKSGGVSFAMAALESTGVLEAPAEGGCARPGAPDGDAGPQREAAEHGGGLLLPPPPLRRRSWPLSRALTRLQPSLPLSPLTPSCGAC